MKNEEVRQSIDAVRTPIFDSPRLGLWRCEKWKVERWKRQRRARAASQRRALELVRDEILF